MDGMTYADMGRLGREHPRTVRRKIERIVARLYSPEFTLAVMYPELLPRDLTRLAKLLYVEGRSIRDAARLSKRSLHQVRTQRTAIQALARVHVPRGATI